MPIRLSCPSCNTTFTLPQLPADRRTTCRRCGDVFPIRTFTEVAESPENSAVKASPTATAQLSRKTIAQRSVMRTVAIALGLGFLGLMAGFTVHYLHNRAKPKPESEPEFQPMTAKPAVQLSGLGFLPADTNIVFAFQPGPVLAYTARINRDPQDLLLQTGNFARSLDFLTHLGITLSQIDHLVGGTSLGDGAFMLRLTVVLVLRKPLADEDEFLHKLKARELSGKPRYTIDLNGFPLLLARVSPTTWVFGYDDSDFQAVDRGGYPFGGKQFPDGLTRSIVKIPLNAAVWIATDDEQWAEKPGIKLAIGEWLKKKEWLPVLAKGRSALVTMTFDEPPRIRMFIKTIDETTDQQLLTFFKKQTEMNDGIQQDIAEDLVFFDAPFNPMNVIPTIKKYLDSAGKP